MMKSMYYDTNVFEHALNPNYCFFEYCSKLCDPSLISWRIVISEWVRAEFQNDELLDTLAVQLATNGQGVLDEVAHEPVDALKRLKNFTKRKLSSYGMSAIDINHAFAAAASGCPTLTTDDPDFWDPAQKSGGETTRVQDLLIRDLSLSVLSTPEACEHLGIQ